jgi:DNA-directed RNA polymerase specialized sigma24 family protein
MFGTMKTPSQRPGRYATSADFCRIFEKNMDRLYLLSLLLTGNHAAAENCFVQGLGDSKEGNPVFKEWAESWARRTIVQNAIQMVHPRPEDVLPSDTAEENAVASSQPAEVTAILALPTFDRFAYVLSVLEGYSLQECALLLDCSRGDLITARMRALQEVVRLLEMNHSLSKDASNRTPHEAVILDQFSRLAATA